ncbi:MAG: hypothetical protein ACLUJG_07645 [Lawsonibacter sp.]
MTRSTQSLQKANDPCSLPHNLLLLNIKTILSFAVLGAGPLYGTAYSMANCHFMEMHWRNAIMIHSGEYFHGPFEMTSETQPTILLMATGRSRFLDERVLKFLKTYAKRFIVIDAKDTGIEEHIIPELPNFSTLW